MEQYQKDHIRKNLPRLLEFTRCSDLLFAYLISNKVLFQEEVDEISSKKTPSSQSTELYRIVQTKENGYTLIIEALQATNQTGAVALLTLPNRAKQRLETIVGDCGIPQAIKRAKTSQSNIRFEVRAPSHLFSGRCEELEQLHRIFQQISTSSSRITVITQTISISGLGGIGKTQLAREYINKHSSDFDNNVVWMNAENEDALAACFRRLSADHLRISTKNANGVEKDIITVVSDVYGAFADCHSLFVFDNAEKDDYMIKFLPQIFSDGDSTKLFPYILITSRNKDWVTDSYHVVPLKELKLEDAIEFVVKGLQIKEISQDIHNLITSLVNRLQCFPLAIQQAISYIKEESAMGDYNIQDYLDEFENNQVELLDSVFRSLHDDYQKTTFTTWKMTLEKIANKPGIGSCAVHILNCVAYLSAENIQRAMLFKIFSCKSEKELKLAVNLLISYSMINGEQKQSVLNVHRMVQQVIRLQLSSTNKESEILEEILQFMAEQNVNSLVSYIDHALCLWSHTRPYSDLLSKFCQLPKRIIEAMTQELRYSEAVIFGSTGIKLLEATLSPTHAETLTLEWKVCELLYQKGEFKTSLEHVTGLVGKCNSLSIQSSILLDCQCLIASINRQQGNLTEGITNFLEVLELAKAIPEWEKESYAECLWKTAGCSWELGRYEEALKYNEQALQVMTDVYGPDHHRVASLAHSKSLIIASMGNYKGTLSVLEDLYSKSMSPRLTVQVQHNFAYYLSRVGEYERALKLCEEAIAGRTASLGEMHPNTLFTMELKGSIMLCKGESAEETVEVLRKAYGGLLHALGESQMHTLEAKAHFAMAWYRKDRSDEALFTIEETVRLHEEIIGKENILTICVFIDYAIVLGHMGEYERSLTILEDVRQRIEKRYGSEHFELKRVAALMIWINEKTQRN